MQAILMILMSSLVFLMFSAMVTGLGQNIKQANIEKIEVTKRLFADIQELLSNVVYKERNSLGKSVVDLSDSSYTDLSGNYIASKISFSKPNIEKDQWGTDIYLVKKTEKETIWGGPGSQKAVAPISTILLVSAGPNKTHELFSHWGTFNPTITQIKTTDIDNESIVGDDIVVRFSNYEAMLDIWERTESLDNTVKQIAKEYYKNQLDAFSPIIQIAQRDSSIANAKLKDDIFNQDHGGNLDVDANYNVFESLESGQDDVLNTEWNESGQELFTRLINLYRRNGAKEFTLADFNLPTDVETAFRDEYVTRKFLFPSFDIVERNSLGGMLLASDRGLKNIGIPGIDTLDPFNGVDGAIDYSYDLGTDPVNNPDGLNKITVIRKATPLSLAEHKWTIDKRLEIDGLE